MLDRKCYNQMCKFFSEEVETADIECYAKLFLSASKLLLEEHKYEYYWHEFEEHAIDQRLTDRVITAGILKVYKDIFKAFEEYVKEQLENE